MKRVLIIGAGPMGIEAGLGAAERGFDVTILEKGRPGESLRRWGSTRFFSPFGMNVSARARARLGVRAPAEDAILTGAELVERVLEPLTGEGPLAGRVRSGCTVRAVSRARMTRTDMPGHPIRFERPFRVLADTPAGEEVLEADHVLDASGVYDTPAPIGAGAPAKGERAAQAIRHLGALEAKLGSLAGKHLLLVGHGHSAANAIALLELRAKAGEPVKVTWAVRSANRRPCVEVACDPLPERKEVVSRANALAEKPPAFLTVERRAIVEAIEPRPGGGYTVGLTGGRTVSPDAIAAFTGYRPDHSIHAELAVSLSPVTEGAAGLARALASVTDCLSVPAVKAEDLGSGEPGFHLIGSKSYGRSSSFLLRTGLAQLETILEGLGRSR